ncbi:MAG: hypothetical protein LBR73_02805 [Oscillospiraceae bacterium]|jgi:hypothetical protein|nr:hypothetical protein [Oscillospiraceae bacterium]
MALVLPRLIPAALGLFLAILHLVRVKAQKRTAQRVLAIACGVLGLGLLAQVGGSLADATVTTLLTTVPWLVLGALFIGQAVLTFLSETSDLRGAFLAVAGIQLGLAIYFLITRWQNLSVGEAMWLQLQIALAILLLIDTVLYLFAALHRKGEKVDA